MCSGQLVDYLCIHGVLDGSSSVVDVVFSDNCVNDSLIPAQLDLVPLRTEGYAISLI